jgi:demethylmenaquinone methyltransferase/2-methoxy-6-polyprenyl-1,4-benzoquinol methylase
VTDVSQTSTTRTPPIGDELPVGEAKVAAVRDMFDRIAPRYDLVNRVMTFRLDVGWRRHTIRTLRLPAGSRVLDLACGTGDFCRELEGAGLAPIGVDISWGMLANARTRAPLVHGDALHLPVPDGAVDGATCGFALRNVLDLPGFMAELARVVRPGGRIGLLEVAEPERAVLRMGHGLYFNRIVPWVGGMLSDRSAYRYLPKSVAYLPPPVELVAMIRDAGFANVERELLFGGASQLLSATRT